MNLIKKIAVLSLSVIALNAYAMNEKQASEMLPITITSIDAPVQSRFITILKINYEIENKGDKDIDAIKAAIVIQNPDGAVFKSLNVNTVSIKANTKVNDTFGYDFDENKFDDKKLQKLGTRLKAWLRVEEIIYSDGSYVNISK